MNLESNSQLQLKYLVNTNLRQTYSRFPSIKSEFSQLYDIYSYCSDILSFFWMFWRESLIFLRRGSTLQWRSRIVPVRQWPSMSAWLSWWPTLGLRYCGLPPLTQINKLVRERLFEIDRFYIGQYFVVVNKSAVHKWF